MDEHAGDREYCSLQKKEKRTRSAEGSRRRRREKEGKNRRRDVCVKEWRRSIHRSIDPSIDGENSTKCLGRTRMRRESGRDTSLGNHSSALYKSESISPGQSGGATSSCGWWTVRVRSNSASVSLKMFASNSSDEDAATTGCDA